MNKFIYYHYEEVKNPNFGKSKSWWQKKEPKYITKLIGNYLIIKNGFLCLGRKVKSKRPY